ncbi:MAG: formate dehydrogenase subunit alpha [Candidatus Methanofastidiosa archaeon]|nr:formate dehydrogenase subunit alpha [Candidatus Methanofastidiosa archaeon]
MKYDNILTTCPFCGCGCKYYIQVVDGVAKSVLPCKEDPISEGHLCIKGWNAIDFVYSKERLTTPLIKENGAFREATWDEAYGLIASKFKEIKARDGAKAFGFFSSAKTTNEENYLMQKLARGVIVTNNVDHCARLCHASTVAGLAASFGSGAMTNSIPEVEDVDCFLITGSNTTEQHPLIGSRIYKAKEKGAKVILVDPRSIQLASIADIHLRQKPGTDVAWLNGLMHVIIKEGIADEEFIEQRTENYGEFKAEVMKYTPERVEEITGIPKADLIAAARMFANAEAASIIYSMGITQHTTGVDNVKSCANLAMLTGNLGKPSTGVNPLRGQNNVQGACDLGALPNVFPGYQAVTVPENREKFEKAWNMAEHIPESIGLTVVEMLNAAHDGALKCLYIMGENPMISDPDITHVREALDALEFLVVQDLFITETAEHADVILPGTSFLEKDGTFTGTDRRVQRIRKAIEPLGNARPDWEILCDVAKHLGSDQFVYASPKEIQDEVASLTPLYGGVTYERLDKEGYLQWPCPNAEHPGTVFLHNGKFSRGLGHFFPVSYKPPAEEPDKDYPLILTTGRILFHFHTGTMTRCSPKLNKEVPTGYVEIHPSDAEAMGIADGDLVQVSTRRGTIQIPAYVTRKVPEKTVFIPFHFKECAANMLTNPALDPIAKIPEFKVCACKVEALGESS